MSEETIQLYARAGEVLAEGVKEVPGEIQWMPPGNHACSFSTPDGEGKDLAVRVTAETAAIIQAKFLAMQAESAAGRGDKPYFDFNHSDAEASGHPTEFFWGGDDPIQGGVRAKVAWSAKGQAAIQGREYRRFSPAFTAVKSGRITGAEPNMGGLVNRAAFQTIAPIWGKQQEKQNMDTTEQLQKELEQVREENQQLRAKAAKAEDQGKTIKLETQVANLEEENQRLRAKQSESEADAAIGDAVRLGKLPAKNINLLAKWRANYIKNPEDTQALLAEMPASQVLLAIVPRQVSSDAAGSGVDHPFIVQAKAFARDNKLGLAEAISAVNRMNPGLYEDYRETLQLGPRKQ